jgi:lipopolysaccharide/colanic/teichoic acid biosynthesis glycosyltransferase
LGFIALIVFLASIGVFVLAVVTLALGGREVYRNVRYAQKDAEAWIVRFKEYTDGFQENVKVMQARGEYINRMGLEMRESLDDVRDVMEELRSSRLVKAVAFLARKHGARS